MSSFIGIYGTTISVDCPYISIDIEGALQGDIFESVDGKYQLVYYNNSFRIVSDDPSTYIPDYTTFKNIDKTI